MNKLEWITIDCPACRNVNRKARRACGFCDGTGTAKKRVPIPEESVEELMEQAREDEARLKHLLTGEPAPLSIVMDGQARNELILEGAVGKGVKVHHDS